MIATAETARHRPTGWLERIAAGAVNRVATVRVDAGAGGGAVARIVHRLGWPAIASGVAGGDDQLIESVRRAPSGAD